MSFPQMAGLGRFLVSGVLILLLMGVLIYALNHKTINRYSTQFQKPTETSIRGEWVGVMDATARPGYRSVKSQAVIRLVLQLSDAYLNKYSGTGEFKTQGGSNRPLTVRLLWANPDGTFHGDLSGGTEAESDAQRAELESELGKPLVKPFDESIGGHDLEGSFQGETMKFSLDYAQFTYNGTLHHADEAEYRRLCALLPPASRPISLHEGSHGTH